MSEIVQKTKTWKESLPDKLFVVWLFALLVTIIGLSGAVASLALEDGTPQWLLDITQADRPLQSASRMLATGTVGGTLMALIGGTRAWLNGRPRLAWSHAVLAVVNAGVVVFVATIAV